MATHGLSTEFVADQTAPRRIRRLLRPWLDDQGLTPDETWNLVQAVDEAAANVVQHAYAGETAPGQIMIDWWFESHSAGAHVVVMIVDQGRWRIDPPVGGRRGRGLRLMRSCCEHVRVEPAWDGTSVTLVSHTLARLA